MSYRLLVGCGNVEHCGVSVSKQCITALTVMYLRLLPVKYQITAHRPFMRCMKFNNSTVYKSAQ